MAKKTAKREFTNPFTEAFIPIWELWKQYKAEEWQFKYKSLITEQMALNSLVELSGGHELTAIQIIKQSIAQRWKGFFALKTVNIKADGQQQTTNNSQTRQSVNDFYANSGRKW
jgi:hypothetical protein